ncbi:unnamed protein product [Sympodiomycopsis kandeliae]
MSKRVTASKPSDPSSTSSDVNPQTNPELPLQEDPSNPGRFVKHKKQNRAYLKHQEWKKSESARRLASGETEAVPIQLSSILKWLFITLISIPILGHFITGDLFWTYQGKWRNPSRWIPVKQRTFTMNELSLYNGRDSSRPIYIAILGNVYDVTKGGTAYSPGGSYDFFAGRDASRAYTTGCFKTHLTHDLRGLSQVEIEQIKAWETFFANHPRYFKVGTVKLPSIPEDSPLPEPCN